MTISTFTPTTMVIGSNVANTLHIVSTRVRKPWLPWTRVRNSVNQVMTELVPESWGIVQNNPLVILTAQVTNHQIIKMSKPPRYWHFARVINQLPVYSFTKGLFCGKHDHITMSSWKVLHIKHFQRYNSRFHILLYIYASYQLSLHAY